MLRSIDGWCVCVCVVLLENTGLSHGRESVVFTTKKPKFEEDWRRTKKGEIGELRYAFKLVWKSVLVS